MPWSTSGGCRRSAYAHASLTVSTVGRRGAAAPPPPLLGGVGGGPGGGAAPLPHRTAVDGVLDLVVGQIADRVGKAGAVDAEQDSAALLVGEPALPGDD